MKDCNWSINQIEMVQCMCLFAGSIWRSMKIIWGRYARRCELFLSNAIYQDSEQHLLKGRYVQYTVDAL